MILREVSLHNFGPFLGRHLLNLAPQSHVGNSPRSVTLIGALNGSGKTTLLDSIQLALYGARARCSSRKNVSYQDFLRQSIHTKAPKSEGASVGLEFDYPTPRGVDRLKVVRLWRITGKGVSEETKVYRESHDDAELTATWNERVEDIIPLGISNLFFFDGEQVRELATATKATPEVQLAIRTLLGLDLPQQLQTDLSVIVTRRQKSRINDETKRTAVEALENEIRSAESMRIASFEKLAQLRNALIIAEKNLEVKRQEFVIRGGDTANRRSEIDEEIARLKVQSSANRERIRELLSGSLPLGLARDLLERALTRATTEREHLDSRLIQELIEERDGRILASLDSGKFPKKARDFLREVLDQDRSTRFIPLGSEPYLNASREGIALANANLNDAIEVVSKQTGEALHGINTTETQLQALEAKLAVAAPSEQAQSQLLQVETASNEVAKIRVEIDRTQTIYDESVSKVERLRAKLERALRDLATDQGLQAEDSRVIAAAERVMGVMERFKSSLLAKRVHDLERRTLEFFSSLARKRGLLGSVSLNVQTFELQLFDNDGLAFHHDRMSAGEQQLLAVSFLWALASASGRNLPVVIDTPLGRMDHEHRASLVSRYFPMVSHQVVLLSTDAEIDQHYHQVLVKQRCLEREYTLQFDDNTRCTHIVEGYFRSRDE